MFQVFSLFMYSKRTFLTLEKTKKKKKLYIWGYFSIFTWVFCVIKRVMGVFLVFSHFVLNFLIKNLLACVSHMPASGWRV